MCQSIRSANLKRKRLRHRWFPVNITEFLEKHLFYRTPPAATSGKFKVSKICKISVPAIFDCIWYHGLPLHCDKIVAKHDDHRKLFVVEPIHNAIINFRIFK